VRALRFHGPLGKFTWRMLATVMAGQSVAVFLGGLVARGLASARGEGDSGMLLVGGAALALLCVVAAGTMRRPWGVTLGWLVQVATLASALVLPGMLLVALVFLALWLLCMVQGDKVDRLQEQRAAGSPAPEDGDVAR
jgi:hypothetical protein